MSNSKNELTEFTFSPALTVKVFKEGEIRRMPFSTVTYNLLLTQFLALYQIDSTRTKLVVKYLDEDGDKITISTDHELAVMFDTFTQLAGLKHFSMLKIIRLYIELEPLPTLTSSGHPHYETPRYAAFGSNTCRFKSKHKKYGHGYSHGHGHGYSHENWNVSQSSSSDDNSEAMSMGAMKRKGSMGKDEWREYKRQCKRAKCERKKAWKQEYRSLHKMEKCKRKQMKRLYKENYHGKAKKQFSAKFIENVTYPKNTPVQANTTFRKTWRVFNNGEQAWPAETCVVFFPKCSTNVSSRQVQHVGSVPAGEMCEVSVEISAPKETGQFCTLWKLCVQDALWTKETKRFFFGQKLWCKVIVVEELQGEEEQEKNSEVCEGEMKNTGESSGMSEDVEVEMEGKDGYYEEMLKRLQEMGFGDEDRNERLLREHQGDLAKVVYDLATNN